MAMEFTDSNFEQEVLQSEQPVLVDFWAEWCGPCHMIAPTIDEIAREYNGKLKVGKVNVDFNPEISMKYGIRSIPAILLFKGGQLVEQMVGASPKHHIVKMLGSHVEQPGQAA